MVFTVTHVENAAREKQSVRTSERAAQRITIGPVTARSSSHHRRDHAALQIDPSDDVALGVRDVDAAVWRVRDAFWSVQFRSACRTAVARVSRLAGARDAREALRLSIDLEDGVPFAQREIHVAVRVGIDRSRAIERGALEW